MPEKQPLYNLRLKLLESMRIRTRVVVSWETAPLSHSGGFGAAGLRARILGVLIGP